MMKFRLKKAAALMLTVMLAAAALCGCGNKFNGKETALTVNGEAVTAGTVSFEAHYEAALFYTYYSSYFGNSGYFDLESGDEDGKTIGQRTVVTTAESIRDDLILKQHAEEFGAGLTEEQTAAIEEVANSFMEKNGKDVIEKLGVSKEDIIFSLTLDTIHANMLEPMAKDVDTEVSDEEAQQTSITYVGVDVETEDAEDGTSADDLNAQNKEKLEQVLAKIKESDDVASADMRQIAIDIDDTFSTLSTNFSANDAEQETVDKVLAETVKGMNDGELYDGILTSSDGGRYYIVRLDKTFDETATENRKGTIVSDRKQAHFNELLEQWKGEAEVTMNDDVLAKITITDAEPYTFKLKESEEESE